MTWSLTYFDQFIRKVGGGHIHPAGDVTRISVVPGKVTVKIGGCRELVAGMPG